MPLQYGCRTLPYTTSTDADDSDRVQRLTIWDDQVGSVLSNAGNVGLETGGNARTYWVPQGNYMAAAGTRVTGEAGGNTPNNSKDTIRGGPSLRREHLFSIDVRGFDKMFVEWRGEVVSASGFALGGGGIPATFARAYYHSNGHAWAAGTFSEDAGISYMREPHTVCYNSAQQGLNGSTMAGEVDGTAIQPIEIAGGFSLVARGFGHNGGATAGDYRTLYPWQEKAILTHDFVSTGWRLSQGGMLWGYTQRDSSVDNSRYPQAGDRFGWAYQIGYAEDIPVAAPGTFNVSVGQVPYGNSGHLKISGLSRVWVAMYEIFPATLATPLWLDFTTATMTIKGKITATLIRDFPVKR